MSALSIRSAIRLYHLLEFVLPDPPPPTVMEYIQQIVYNITVTRQHTIYVEALALMQGTDVDTILQTYTPEESIAQFILGLEENQVLSLREFCKRVGI